MIKTCREHSLTSKLRLLQAVAPVVREDSQINFFMQGILWTLFLALPPPLQSVHPPKTDFFERN